MKRAIRTALAVAACVACMNTISAADEPAVREEIRGIYSFSPHKLTTEQIADKSRVLDGLWTRAKARKEAYIPVLRSELERSEGRPFFYYDGSMLLLSLSDTALDRRIALDAISRCDLRDIKHTDYFRQVHRLASLGANTTKAALHILDDPEFTAFIHQHTLTLGQNYALIYMVFPLDPALWIPPVLDRLGVETDPTAQKSLLLLAWYAQTEETDAAIAEFAADEAKPVDVREYARELTARNANVGVLAQVTAMLQSEAALRDERRELMKRVSDEALIEFDEKTAQLAAKRD